MSILHAGLPAQGLDSAPYAYGTPDVQGDFKTLPEDFVVEEVLGFEPSGAGEHLFLQLQTDDQNTRYTVKCLARLFSVRPRQVSYSGLKDRRGLTSQWFSIHLPGVNPEPDAERLSAEGMNLLQHGRHHRKLRIGTHKANGFHIRLRNLTPGSLEQRVQLVREQGVPNYFGAQRFGHGGNNVAEALHWAQAGELPQERALRSRVLSTLRSWYFNGSLGQRVVQGDWCRWTAGDPIMLDGSQSYFVEEAWSDTLQQRFDRGDIHLGGWLPGADSPALPSDHGLLLKLANIKAEPRPLRLLPRNLQLEPHGDHLLLRFELPKGAYATSVLRELVQLNDHSGFQDK
ncbi:MAG: tRNA pseudouridine(13) synthase TruD [Pseudomonadota bacterium]|nr:tRNA pseudouridine(13) synthase TruD [Pseudomonadota bacterium]